MVTIPFAFHGFQNQPRTETFQRAYDKFICHHHRYNHTTVNFTITVSLDVMPCSLANVSEKYAVSISRMFYLEDGTSETLVPI
jgi:hypothetical protein